MRESLARFGTAGTALIFGSVAVWLLLLIVVPHLMLIDYAFHANPGAIDKGLATEGWTLHSFRPLFDPSDALAFNTFVRTLLTSAVITLLALVVCYPIAYYLAKVCSAKWLNLFMLCLLVPYWVNEVLRAYAWRTLMARQGLLNQAAGALGLAPVDYFNYELPILDANIALFVGLVYSYILFMVFPMFTAMESLDTNQIEAARDLGAPWWRIHFDVVMPYAKPGIASGCTLVFMLAAGALAAPLVLGGPKSLWFTPIVYDRFYQAFNWNQGSAYAIILLLTCIAFVLLVMRLFKVSFSEIAR